MLFHLFHSTRVPLAQALLAVTFVTLSAIAPAAENPENAPSPPRNEKNHSCKVSTREAFARLQAQHPTFQTVPLRSIFLNEDIQRGIRYLRTSAEREPYRAIVKEGKLVWASDFSPIDTSSASTIETRLADSEPGNAIFVMDGDGKIYVSLYQKKREFYHSSLLAGEPVASAGEIRVKHGKIEMLSNRSGHYRPNEAIFRQILTQLSRKGIPADPIEIEIYPKTVILPKRSRTGGNPVEAGP